MTYSKFLSLLFLSPFFFISNVNAQAPRREKENPPRLKEIQYRWCQPLTEKQLRQRERWGLVFHREVGKEAGERRYGMRAGKWTFWDKEGKKMAEGECQAQPPQRETHEHGVWSYWDLEGRKVNMNWTYGDFDGLWTLYDVKGKERWKFEIKKDTPRKEIFADTKYLSSEGLLNQVPQRPKEDHD